MKSNIQNGNGGSESVKISPPELLCARIPIRGFAPLCINHFGEKTKNKLMDQMREGQKAKNKKMREPRDYDQDFKNASYISTEGWYGFPASSIRNASISACKVAGIVMTRAKLSIFCEEDGFDQQDATPLVRIIGGEPELYSAPVRNATGVVDIRVRPMWRPGWKAMVNLSWDANQFDLTSLLNLLDRAGLQVGIGEGRPDSKQSNGIGYGRFSIDRDVANIEVHKFQPRWREAA